jgi:hypothetical protein
MSLSGMRTDLSRGDSYCQIELLRNERGLGVDLNLDFKLDLPELKLAKQEELEVTYDVPKIMKVADRKDGRVVVMMVNVTKILDTADDFEP